MPRNGARLESSWPEAVVIRSDMAEQPEHAVTRVELRNTIRSIRTALHNHENPTEEILEVVAELGQIEEQFLNGLSPTAPLRIGSVSVHARRNSGDGSVRA